MLRMLLDGETVTCDGKPVPGAFAVDERGGVVRGYVLDGHGKRVMEGERSTVETLKGKVVVSKGSEAKNAKSVKQTLTEGTKEEQSQQTE